MVSEKIVDYNIHIRVYAYVYVCTNTHAHSRIHISGWYTVYMSAGVPPQPHTYFTFPFNPALSLLILTSFVAPPCFTIVYNLGNY